MQNLLQKEDLVGAEFVHWSINGPGIGQEINRQGKCILCAAHQMYFCKNAVTTYALRT